MPEMPKKAFNFSYVVDNVRARSRNASTAEKFRKGEFVLATLNNPLTREEGFATQRGAYRGQHYHVGIGSRNDQIDVLLLDNVAQRSRDTPRRNGQQIISISSGLLEKEGAVVTADKHDGRVTGPQAAYQVACCRRTGLKNKHLRPHAELPQTTPCSLRG